MEASLCAAEPSALATPLLEVAEALGHVRVAYCPRARVLERAAVELELIAEQLAAKGTA